MNTKQNHYLSELEQEFDLDNAETEGIVNDAYLPNNEMDSYETDEEWETDQEWETDEEYDASELTNEMESDNELNEEWEASQNWLNEYNNTDREYEDKLYQVLTSEHESSYELEQSMDAVLHEMEMEYFWGAAKKLWNKHKGKLMGIANKYLPKGTLQALGSLAGGDIRGLLKSDLFKKAISLGANAIAPGVGGAIANGLLNNEVGNNTNMRQQAAQAAQLVRNAYKNMATQMTNLQPGNVQSQIRQMSKNALNHAINNRQDYKGRHKRVISILPNSIVSVHPTKIIIYS